MSKRFQTDKELLKACFNSDRAAMEEFIRKFSKLVYYSIHQAFKIKSISPQPEEIEDLFGDIFLSLFESDFTRLRSFKGRNGCSLASWIRLISSRRSIDYMRERGRNHSVRQMEDFAIEEHTSADNPEDELFEKERASLASEIVSTLPPDDLVFLSLYYEQELDPEKIADILHVSVGTVYSKKHRLQDKLRRMLKKD